MADQLHIIRIPGKDNDGVYFFCDLGGVNGERYVCRFVARNNEQGKSIIRVEVFDGAVSLLKNASLSFNLLGGISLE